MLALSGHPQAAAILSALQDNRLFARITDKALFIKADDGSFVDAATGKPAPDVMASGLRQVRMNNAVRGEVDAALGSLRLFSPDAAIATRRCRGGVPFARSRGIAGIGTRIANAKADAGVKRRMEQARAAALLFADNTSDADRLAAVDVMRARGDIDSRSLLASLSGRKPRGDPGRSRSGDRDRS